MREYANAIASFLKREDGPTAVEYAAIVALIVVVCIAAIAIIGSGSSDFFNAAGTGAGSPVTGP